MRENKLLQGTVKKVIIMVKLFFSAFVVFCLAKVCLAPGNIECEPDGSRVCSFGHDENNCVANVDSTEKCRQSTKKSTDTEPSSDVPQTDHLTQLTSIIARIYDIVLVVVDIGLKFAHIVMIWKHSITKNKNINQTIYHGDVTYYISNQNSEKNLMNEGGRNVISKWLDVICKIIETRAGTSSKIYYFFIQILFLCVMYYQSCYC